MDVVHFIQNNPPTVSCPQSATELPRAPATLIALFVSLLTAYLLKRLSFEEAKRARKRERERERGKDQCIQVSSGSALDV